MESDINKQSPIPREESGSDYILASSSPRRKELFSTLGYPFTIVVPGYDESLTKEVIADEHVEKNAREKGLWVTRQPCLFPNRGQVIISADTIVVLHGQILNKPKDTNDSRGMLESLSGREHEVKTGIAVFCRAPGSDVWSTDFDLVTTKVTFRKLAMDEIEAYIATGEPADKAGSYGIQGLGGAFVESISGSYSNVVGLPLAELRCRLAGLK